MLRMRGITKRFPGTLALDEVDFDVDGGTIHGLLGENGAGKSTLLKILAGDYQASEGTIEIDGEPASIESPRMARALGIGIVYQEMSLLPNLTVAAEHLARRRADAERADRRAGDDGRPHARRSRRSGSPPSIPTARSERSRSPSGSSSRSPAS